MDRMTCQELVDLVTAFLDNTLDAETEFRFIEHLATCKDCEAYLGQIRRTICSLGDLPAQNLPNHVRDALLRAFRNWLGSDNGTGNAPTEGDT